MTDTAIPDPEVEPTIELWPRAGRALGYGRSTAYAAVRDGTFPVPLIHVGNKIRVPTARLRGYLGLTHPGGAGNNEGEPDG